MKSLEHFALVAMIASLSIAGAAAAQAEPGVSDSRIGLSLLGGVQALNKNDTAIPDHFINVPAVVNARYYVTPILAVEGDFTWMIPIQQSVDLGSTGTQDRKTPNILAYQAGLRADLPRSAWTPYVAAGAGAMTFLSNNDSDRVPQLDQSQTMFALNFGAGTEVGISPHVNLQGDFREFAAFPASDASGFSQGGSADPIWMERITVGIGYRF